MRCFIQDEGRPLEVGLQRQASNCPELRRLRVFVVSVAGKGRARSSQVRVKETNESKPSMTCRKFLDDVETNAGSSVRDQAGGNLLTAQSASGIKAA